MPNIRTTSKISALAFAFLCLSSIGACSAVSPVTQQALTDANETSKIYWSDGDSGRLNGKRFRLYSVDAPETGGVGSRGGAKCEVERVKGYKAKEYIVELTRNAEVKIARSYGFDKTEEPRLLIDLTANGKDVGVAGIQAGLLAPWPHEGSKKLAAKPDWCR